MKVCKKALGICSRDGYYSIQTNCVEIRIWFLTDSIIRIRAGFDGNFAEGSYSLVMTAWEDPMDDLMKDYRKRILPAESELTDGEKQAVIQGKQLRVVVDKEPFSIRIYDQDGTMLHGDIVDLAYQEDSNRRRIHTSEITPEDCFYGLSLIHI